MNLSSGNFLLLTVGLDNTLMKEFSIKNDLASDERRSITGEDMLLTEASSSIVVSNFGAFSFPYASGSRFAVMPLDVKASSGIIFEAKRKIPVA